MTQPDTTPDNLSLLSDAADSPADRPEYVSGREGLAIVRRAGIGIGPELWYRKLKAGEIPGQITLGRKYFVPSNVVERLAGQQTKS